MVFMWDSLLLFLLIQKTYNHNAVEPLLIHTQPKFPRAWWRFCLILHITRNENKGQKQIEQTTKMAVLKKKYIYFFSSAAFPAASRTQHSDLNKCRHDYLQYVYAVPNQVFKEDTLLSVRLYLALRLLVHAKVEVPTTAGTPPAPHDLCIRIPDTMLCALV